MHASCAKIDNVNLRWKCTTCVGALKPEEQEELEHRLGKREWVEEDSESEEFEEEAKTESEEEEVYDNLAVEDDGNTQAELGRHRRASN